VTELFTRVDLKEPEIFNDSSCLQTMGNLIKAILRRAVLGMVCLGCILSRVASAGPEAAKITMDYVMQRALERAQKPFHSPKGELPDFLKADKLDYDKYREIRFRDDQALWAKDKLPFRAEFFHPGYLYEEPIHLNEFFGGYVQPIRFVQDFFDYG
jgi:glucans biosynthesis protein